MKEVWKDIPDYEGMYQVSNLGRVRSLDRLINNDKGKYIRNGQILSNRDDGHGYWCVSLWKNNKYKHFKVHQLMAIVFLNHKPNGHKIVVDHINNISKDNRLENLQIITQRENLSKDQNNRTSEYTGVSFDKAYNKLKSSIKINKKSIHLGMYDSEIEASEMYQLAVKNIKHYNGNPKEFREYLNNFY